MIFKIKHEHEWILRIMPFCILIIFASAFAFVYGFPEWILYPSIYGTSLLMILYPLGQAIGTSVIIEADAVTIQYIIYKRRISPCDISNPDIEAYRRNHRKKSGYTYTTYHLQMTIWLCDGKKVTLNQRVSKSDYELVKSGNQPDSEVQLYMAYTAICSIM